MNEMSLRQKAVLAVLALVALYVFAAVLWFTRQESAWKRAADRYDSARKTYEKERRLVGERQKWNDAYDSEKAQMPTFGFGKATDTTWLQKMDELAEKHHISIARRKSGKEESRGDVLELPIEAEWQGAPESLVRFLHELENTSEGMFDIGSLNFRPNARTGYLKGSFTLTCAYMREE